MGSDFESGRGVEQTSDPSGKILEEVSSKIGESGGSGASSIGGALAGNSASVVRVVKHSGAGGDDDSNNDNNDNKGKTSNSVSGKKELINKIISEIDEYNLKQKEEQNKVSTNALESDK